MPDVTLDKMAEWIDRRGVSPESFCFSRKDGWPVSKASAELAFHFALQSAGFIETVEGNQKKNRAIKPTDGRKLVPHSFISRMWRELSAKELQPMTGHVSEGMVDYYNRKVLDLALAALPERGKEASDSLFI